MTSSAAAVLLLDSIHASLASLSSPDYANSPFDLPRRFSAFSLRLHLALIHLSRSPSSFSPSVITALKGISAELDAVTKTMSFYTGGKIFVLIHCLSLSKSLAESASAVSRWLSLLDSALDDLPDLRKRIADLSRDLKQAQFQVTANEERVHHTLRREGGTTPRTKTNRAVESAIVMDLARALGIDAENQAELFEQIKQLRKDIANGTNTASERPILASLEKIMENMTTPPKQNLTPALEFEDDENGQIAPFKNFLCPLTKEVMRDPVVVLQSSQTYERSAVKYWFERCLDDGREPTCPVTGQVLQSLELKLNIGLAGAIDEWVNRNVEILVKIGARKLSEEPLLVMDGIESVLSNVYSICEDYPSCRFRVRNAGIPALVVKMLRNSSKNIGTHLRSKALMALASMVKDEESKEIMLQEGVTRLAKNSLMGSSEKERECAVKLLLEFSSDEACCVKIAAEKGALVLLTTMAENLEHPGLSNLAEEVLEQMEKVESNVQHLAAAGRFNPLLTRLCEGSENVKIKMASIVGSLTLTNSSKEQIARRSAKILVEMLSNPEGRAASLKSLYNLSGLDDNATILVDSAVLPALTGILFINQDTSSEMKELAASTMAQIVSNPGHWELASADKEGNSMQSELFIHNIVGLLSLASLPCQISLLQILYGIASSPQASESVTSHIRSGEGIKIIVPLLEHTEVENRIEAFRLTRLLSEKLGQDVADELRPCHKLSLFKDKLLEEQAADNERADAACIFANIPLTENEVKTLLEVDFVRWIASTLKNQRQTSIGRISRPASIMFEGLLGLLLHMTKNLNPHILSALREHSLITIFRDQLNYPSHPRVKQLAIVGLKNLSGYARSVAAMESESQPPNGLCFHFMLMCGKSSLQTSQCLIHNIQCEEDNQLCLLKNNCIKPLVDLLNDNDTSVQIAAVEALSTLVIDTSSPSNFKRAVDELEQLGVIKAVIALFLEVRPGELQERTVWIIEKILRVENHRHSMNQGLVWALVEAFRHGNANTKRNAQDALTCLKQLSGVSGNRSHIQTV